MKPIKGWVVIVKLPLSGNYTIMRGSFHTYKRFAIAQFTGHEYPNDISRKIWKGYRTNINKAKCIRATLRADK